MSSSSSASEKLRESIGSAAHRDPALLRSFSDQEELSNENEIRDFLLCSSAEDAATTPYVPAGKECTSKGQLSPSGTLASFGDKGTTASVGTHGNILQFSRYLGVGRSGVICVDHENTLEPWFIVARSLDLQDLARDPSEGVGLRLHFRESPKNAEAPSLSFVHNRWPRFTVETDKAAMSLQYFLHQGTLIQQYDIKVTDSATLEDIFNFELNYFMKLRDQEFIDMSYHFNDEADCPKCSSVQQGPLGYSVIIKHSMLYADDYLHLEKPTTQEDSGLIQEGGSTKSATKDTGEARDKLPNSQDTPEAVSLIMALFVNGRPQKISGKDRWKMTGTEHIDTAGRVRITMAYRLQLASPKRSTWKSCLIPASVSNIDDNLKASLYSSLDFTSSRSRELNFTIGRTLEHILSTCALPVSGKPVWDTFDPSQRGTQEVVNEGAEMGIALTCGDISGHRISTSATFFASQFLLSTYRYLQKNYSENAYAAQLLQRISDTFRKHLCWVFRQLEMDDNGYFYSSYWPCGRHIDGSRGIDSNLMTEGPFQIIKAADFANDIDNTPEELENLKNMVGPLAMAWIKRLDEDNKRGSFAWARSKDIGIGLFRFDDHLWIWKSLKAVEDLGLSAKFTMHHHKAHRTAEQNRHSIDAQRAIIKRFTTENSVSRRRMLAVSRSIRETRFLLHSRDTALFYGMDWGFFGPDSTALDLWDNTIATQSYHEENQDEGWGNSLRYGLMVVMSTMGRQINSRSLPEMFEHAQGILLHSVSSEGLFAGQLDEATKEPRLFGRKEHRDFCYHATFEISYIMLEYGQRSIKPEPDKLSKRHSIILPSPMTYSVPSRLPAPSGQLLQAGTDNSGFDYQLGEFALEGGQASRTEALIMKKRIPFNNLIDQKSVVEFPDEWLYNYPDFLDFEPLPNLKTFDQFVQHLKRLQNDYDEGSLIREGIRSYLESSEKNPGLAKMVFEGDTLELPEELRDCKMMDVAKKLRKVKSKSRYNGGQENVSLSTWDYVQRLGQKRTAQDAKKRLLHIPRASKVSAMLHVISTPDSEKDLLCAFFERHSRYENYFFDDTTAVMNTWETEFHLSFYQLLDESCQDTSMNRIPPPSQDRFPGRGKSIIGRATIGFRFVGDFFDRYWTCYLVEHNPVGNWSLQSDNPEPDTSAWQQRKVLELMLFDWMLRQLVGSTRTIVEETRKELGIHQDRLTFSEFSSDDYSRSHSQWRKFQPILHAVEEMLSAAIRAIDNWKTRETDRGQERPRWTRDDERKYRRAINKLSGSINRRIREVENHRMSIQSLRASLVSTLDSIRNDLDFNGSENIRYFTYVTVVFLPLGFAASVFSMNAAPNHKTLISMVVTAAVALFLTFFAITTAQVSRNRRNDSRGWIERSVEKIMGQKKRLIEEKIKSTSEESTPTSQKKPSIEEKEGGSTSSVHGTNPTKEHSRRYNLRKRFRSIFSKTGLDDGTQATEPV